MSVYCLASLTRAAIASSRRYLSGFSLLLSPYSKKTPVNEQLSFTGRINRGTTRIDAFAPSFFRRTVMRVALSTVANPSTATRLAPFGRPHKSIRRAPPVPLPPSGTLYAAFRAITLLNHRFLLTYAPIITLRSPFVNGFCESFCKNRNDLGYVARFDVVAERGHFRAVII